MPTASTRFDLREIGRCTLDLGDRFPEYVVYTDEVGTYAVDADAFDADTDAPDYSEWCAGEGFGEADDATCALIARECGLAGIRTSGSDRWVPAAA